MNITLAYPSSLEYWRYVSQTGTNLPTSRCALIPPGTPSITREEVNRLATLGVNHPVHVFCSTSQTRRSTNRIACHVTPFPSDREEFIITQDRLQVSTPELCLAQAAAKLPFPELLMLCHEFCGTYRIDPMAKEGYVGGLQPLTTIDKCRKFVEASTGVRGVKALKRALSFVAEDSSSPMQSRLVILLCLPFCYGGYNLPVPTLNATLVIGKRVLYPEMYWPAFMIEVSLRESRSAQKVPFSQRVRFGGSSVIIGLSSITITRPQIAQREELTEVATKLARQMNLRIRPRTVKYPQKQEELRKSLGLRS